MVSGVAGYCSAASLLCDESVWRGGWFYSLLEGLPVSFQLHYARRYLSACEVGGEARGAVVSAVRAGWERLGVAGVVGSDDDDVKVAVASLLPVASRSDYFELVQLCSDMGVAPVGDARWCRRGGGRDVVRCYDLLGVLGAAVGDVLCCSAGSVERMRSRAWWLRRLRGVVSRSFEIEAGVLGLFGGKKGKYCSGFAKKWRFDACRRNEAGLKKMVAVNSNTGESISLFDVAAGTVANPAVRRAELGVRLVGLEGVADSRGWVGLFFTLTASSRFHRVHFNGSVNSRWDGSSPRDGQAFLMSAWSKARAKISYSGIDWFGMRVAEPHHDGCPHWHVLVWCDPCDVDKVTAIVRGAWLSCDGEDVGAFRNRVKVVRMVKERGGKRVSAAAYISKYICKNIDGHGLDFSTTLDDSGGQVRVAGSPGDNAARVDAWASLWGIRQFQEFGGGRVGVWRELRRIREPVGLDFDVEVCRSAADCNDYKVFLEFSGGVKLFRGAAVLSGFGELVSGSVVGVVGVAGRRVVTRFGSWELLRVGDVSGNVPVGEADFDFGVGFCSSIGSPWIPVNNCKLGVKDGYEVGKNGNGGGFEGEVGGCKRKDSFESYDFSGYS